MKRIAVIGDDARQKELRRLFASDGFELCSAGAAECVILSLPAEMPEGMWGVLRPETLLIGGRVMPELMAQSAEHSALIIDYVLREDFAQLNAAATAEGAIQIIMENTPRTLCESGVLVIGNGRIGKLLARKLKALGASTAVSARRAADFAEITAAGHEALDTRALRCELLRFDVVVNTVPALVIDEADIRAMRRDTFLMDLASLPGGIDFDAALRAGVRAIHALSLPGRVAPLSAAGYAYRSIRNIFDEVEENEY